ncbi:BrnA antitoxin family protein [Burkholderia cepacia]|nr:BrnA antitoxin family protein [Burkholderia cepacia]
MTPEEDAAITAAARLDHDNPPLSWADSEGVGPGEWAWIDTELVDRLKADGPDWEVRVNRILREALGL